MRKTALICLLTFSLAINGATGITLLFLWWKDSAQAAQAPAWQKPVQQFLREDLSLTQDLSNSLIERIDKQLPEIIERKKMMDSSRMDMMKLLSTVPVDIDAVEARVKEINRMHGEIRGLTVGTVIKIAESLPPDAQKKFAEYLRERAQNRGVCVPGMGRGPFGDMRRDH